LEEQDEESAKSYLSTISFRKRSKKISFVVEEASLVRIMRSLGDAVDAASPGALDVIFVGRQVDEADEESTGTADGTACRLAHSNHEGGHSNLCLFVGRNIK
jgi:hypothetical protein